MEAQEPPATHWLHHDRLLSSERQWAPEPRHIDQEEVQTYTRQIIIAELRGQMRETLKKMRGRWKFHKTSPNFQVALTKTEATVKKRSSVSVKGYENWIYLLTCLSFAKMVTHSCPKASLLSLRWVSISKKHSRGSHGSKSWWLSLIIMARQSYDSTMEL